MNKTNPVAYFLLGLCLIAVVGLFGALSWNYALGTWLAYFGKPNHLHLWQPLILGFVPVIGQLGFPFAALTWILMLFIG